MRSLRTAFDGFDEYLHLNVHWDQPLCRCVFLGFDLGFAKDLEKTRASTAGSTAHFRSRSIYPETSLFFGKDRWTQGETREKRNGIGSAPLLIETLLALANLEHRYAAVAREYLTA